MPDKDKVVRAYLQEVMKYIDREIFPRRRLSFRRSTRRGACGRSTSWASCTPGSGRTTEAEAEFRKVLAKAPEDVPALLNLGSIYYLRNDLKTARQFYDRAAKKSPNSSSVLLALARVRHETEDYAGASTAYNKLRAVDPKLAEQFAYLGLQGSDAARAADISKTKGVMVWNED